MFLAGEASGDLHGAGLVREILKQRPGTLCFGLGGPRMAAAGMRLDLDLTSRSVIGLWEVLKHLPFFRRAFHQALSLLEREKPDLIVPIDYPGFNLRFAARAHQRGGRVCYYISPQVWAWKAGRVQQMKRFLEKILVVFPFETAWYERAGLPSAFVGHPLMDLISGAGRVRPVGPVRRVGLLPGSRVQEVRALLPVMLEAAAVMAGREKGLKFVILKAPGLPRETYQSWEDPRLDVELTETGGSKDAYALRRSFDLALVASGTATLETAILGTPFLILYRVHPLSYQIAKRVLKLPYIGLINVVAGKKIVPEFVQHELDAARIAEAGLALLKPGEARKRQLMEMKKAVQSLGGPGAARKAAAEVIALAGA